MNGIIKTRITRRLPPVVTFALWVGLLLFGPVCLAHAAPVKITVSILPQAWFVEQIGGDLVEVSVLVGPGHSPAIYEPTPRQMATLEQADLFLAAGVPFEKGLLPRVQALPSAPAIAGPRPDNHGHHHDIDPHTWLDPAQAMALADTVSFRLQTLMPAEAATIEERCGTLKDRLTKVDEQARDILAPYRGRTFFVFHPAFGHFAEAYDLMQVSVETGGHEPGPRHLAEVIERAQALGVRSVIVQPQFSRKSAETVADAIEADIVVLDPLAADYEANFLIIAQTLANLFAAETPKEGS